MLPVLAVPTSLRSLISRLPVAPPSIAFSVLVNRLLWPALKALDWQPLVGRHYALHVKDLGLGLRFTVTPQGFAHDPYAGEPELAISATARDFLLLATRREDPDTLFFSRRLVSEGDTELGLTVKNLLDALDLEAVWRRLPGPLAQLVERLAVV